MRFAPCRLPSEISVQRSRFGYVNRVEPIRETRAALTELSVYGDGSLLDELMEMALAARLIVPELVGVSLGLVEEGLTFTFVATSDELAALDAVQYLDGGPCVAAVDSGEPVQVAESELLDEGKWLMFARAGAAAGVASTLSMPIMDEDQHRVTGGVNLYASSTQAFEGHHHELADVFHAWAPAAVTNADLSFATRQVAAEAPARLQDQSQVEQAVGMVAAAHGVTLEVARQLLRDAAIRAGITLVEVARTVLVQRRI